MAISSGQAALAAADALGYLNMAVWLIPGMFGIAYRRRCSPAVPRSAPR